MNEKLINSIKILTRQFYDAQRERTRIDNMMGMKKSGDYKKGVPEREEEALEALYQRRNGYDIETKKGIQHVMGLFEYEEEMGKRLAKIMHEHPLWDAFLKDIKGCGECMAAVIISEFDINKAPCVSNLWSFAGLAPGKDKKVKGQKCTYNQFLRSKLCGVLGSGFLKAKAPYSEFYYNMKTRLESENWGIESKKPVNKKRPKAGHQHKASTRYMIKMFLKDLYVAWRTLEGLPVREPYQEEYLGKKHTA